MRSELVTRALPGARCEGDLQQSFCETSDLELSEPPLHERLTQVTQRASLASRELFRLDAESFADAYLYFPVAQRPYLGIGFMYSRMML